MSVPTSLYCYYTVIRPTSTSRVQYASAAAWGANLKVRSSLALTKKICARNKKIMCHRQTDCNNCYYDTLTQWGVLLTVRTGTERRGQRGREARLRYVVSYSGSRSSRLSPFLFLLPCLCFVRGAERNHPPD
jgi:hypothetical protein